MNPPAEGAVTAATTEAPAFAPLNPNLKKPIGIALDSKTDQALMRWVDYRAKVSDPSARKPTRGSIITEMIESLLSAGWAPGDKVQVVRKKSKK